MTAYYSLFNKITMIPKVCEKSRPTAHFTWPLPPIPVWPPLGNAAALASPIGHTTGVAPAQQRKISEKSARKIRPMLQLSKLYQ